MMQLIADGPRRSLHAPVRQAHSGENSHRTIARTAGPQRPEERSAGSRAQRSGGDSDHRAARAPLRAVLAIAASLLIVVFAAGCGGNSSSPSSNIPSYAGTWSGTYTITGCNQSGGVALANICGALGNSPPYGFNLTQSSRNVSGSFTLGSIQFPSTGGTVDQGGSLQLSATSTSNGITVIVTWNLTKPANALGGTITQVWQSNTLSGQANVVGTISTSIKTASLLPTLTPQSVQELIQGIAGR